MSNANGTPDTASESGSGTMLSGTAARLTQYPALGPHTMARLIESRATASTMSSGWSAFGSAFKKLPNPTRPTMPRCASACAGGAIDEVVRGAVVGLRRGDRVEPDGGFDHDVAEAAEDRVAHEAAPARPPVVDHARVEIARDDQGDLVLEALFPVVGEGHVVRVGADPELRTRPWRTPHERDRRGGDAHRPGELHPSEMHGSPC